MKSLSVSLSLYLSLSLSLSPSLLCFCLAAISHKSTSQCPVAVAAARARPPLPSSGPLPLPPLTSLIKYETSYQITAPGLNRTRERQWSDKVPSYINDPEEEECGLRSHQRRMKEIRRRRRRRRPAWLPICLRLQIAYDGAKRGLPRGRGAAKKRLCPDRNRPREKLRRARTNGRTRTEELAD